MGAHEFVETAVGKTIVDAYNNACKQAEYEYGHDPYSGTIATTQGVIDVSARLAGLTPKRRDVVARNAVMVQEYEPTFDGPARGSWFRVVDGYTIPKEIKPSEAGIAISLAGMIEKWGPCIGYEITGTAATKLKQEYKRWGHKTRGYRVFRFVGIAAS